jgi:hypothetical protein
MAKITCLSNILDLIICIILNGSLSNVDSVIKHIFRTNPYIYLKSLFDLKYNEYIIHFQMSGVKLHVFIYTIGLLILIKQKHHQYVR